MEYYKMDEKLNTTVFRLSLGGLLGTELPSYDEVSSLESHTGSSTTASGSHMQLSLQVSVCLHINNM